MANASTGSPEDAVIATGRQASVDLSSIWLHLSWDGAVLVGWLQEVGIRADTGAIVVRIDPRYFRLLRLNLFWVSTKANEKLGWKPTTSLEVGVEMVTVDREDAMKEAI